MLCCKSFADKAKDKAKEAADAVAAKLRKEPLPPPREQWTYGLFDSCGCADPGLCLIGCFCPCLATPRIRAYRISGKPDARPSDCSVLASLCVCYFCGDGLMGYEERDQDFPFPFQAFHAKAHRHAWNVSCFD